jgi:hypothetical protein
VREGHGELPVGGQVHRVAQDQRQDRGPGALHRGGTTDRTVLAVSISIPIPIPIPRHYLLTYFFSRR